MSNKTKLTATTPRGVFTRTTARVYTHVVVPLNADGTQYAREQWAGSLALAQKAARKFQGSLYSAAKVEVFPCDWLVEMKAIEGDRSEEQRAVDEAESFQNRRTYGRDE
jgi:hypothetical protein